MGQAKGIISKWKAYINYAAMGKAYFSSLGHELFTMFAYLFNLNSIIFVFI